ncbi:MAG: tRNA (adenosine(37)-N6)-threonylcarbamoyltransferase complex dimerization subunit type 1 TsaB [Cyanobacteria bacterium SW_9_44_58]|nr:MAG: tRNA (adenosine(37)-N6)-threonylcarbamoyltransferase complex dimerization subunit type 1 TsaB [Cyanobacteria bacterium SW_9_44_58]
MDTAANLPGYGLALHTTSPQLGLAISDLNQNQKLAQELTDSKIRSRTWNLDRDLSTHLHVLLQALLAPQNWSDLAFIAVAKGPGSFTGTRIGVATARTLAQQLKIPLFAISTLAGIVAHQLENNPSQFPENQLIAVQLPARRGQYFVAIYQATATGLSPYLADTTMTEQDWEATLEKLSFPYQRIEARQQELGETVSSILKLADQQWQQGERPQIEQAQPFYGQRPV